ncbi:MAG: excinuclease ABC subunit UvrC [bacterium]|jgi:excinuclease ABC subunit C
MNAEKFTTIQQTLPTAAGIYKYYNANGNLLYIGKAKNIRKRVSSYFTNTKLSHKTQELIRQISSIECTVVDSEHDALLLENSLIKEFKPKYNIVLKDDKTYPYIVIKNEPYPRVFITRRKFPDGSLYIGPYTSIGKVRDLFEFIKQHVPLRSCTLNLTEKNITAKKFKVCLEYHLGNCKGPCTGLQTAEDYAAGIRDVKDILKGNLRGVISDYKKKQEQFVEDLEFEKAELIQKKINALKNYRFSSIVVSPKVGDADVFATATYNETLAVSYLSVRNGTINNSGNHVFKLNIEEKTEDILPQAILYVQSLYNSDCKEIIVTEELNFGFEEYKVVVPKSGDKKKLLDLAKTNATYFINELKRKNSLLQLNEEVDKLSLLASVQQSLSLHETPTHIECFDNSNFQGSYPVSAMVCFKDGLPSKKDYRRYNVESVTGINDFASMKEAVERRYGRLIKENESLPQLVIIDGGKGQLSAAVDAIRGLGLEGKMTLIGLAKNVEEIFFVGDKESLKLGYQSDVLRFIRSIRDEVHRYGITFHRNKRSKGTFTNELEEIEGIGKKTVAELLLTFRSVKNIKKASREDLAVVIGNKKAEILSEYFKKQQSRHEAGSGIN